MRREPKSATPFEIEMVKSLISRQTPRRVYLEIGGAAGGSLSGFGRQMDDGATLISVDLPKRSQWGPGGSKEQVERVARSLCEDGYKAHTIIGDSRDPKTQEQVRELLNAREVDVLFIDGDHRLVSVAQDAAVYAPLLRKDGMLIFHDCGIRMNSNLAPEAARNMQGINAIWQDWAFNRKYMLIGQWCGYGVLWI